MPEPTLSTALDEIRREVARFLSFGRDYASLTITQQEDVDAIVRRGLRQFYQPPPVGEHVGHMWSFLRPTVSFATVIGQEAYQLPDDYGAMLGSRITHLSSSSLHGPLIVSDYQYRALKEGSTVADGTPFHATVVPRTSNGAVVSPGRSDLLLWPKPDRVVTMQYQYAAVQDAITNGLSYPAGAAMHGETIIASCLAIGEEYVVSPTTQYRQLFRERLASSIALDRHARGGGIVGRMRGAEEAPVHHHRVSLVTYTP
jgi:hypothetical protein